MAAQMVRMKVERKAAKMVDEMAGMLGLLMIIIRRRGGRRRSNDNNNNKLIRS